MDILQICRVGIFLLIVNGISWSKTQECGLSKYDVDGRRIVNGNDAKPGQWPWQALIYHKKNTSYISYKFKCGGTLIGRKWVLTAAHCVQIECKNAGIRVSLGVTNKEKNETAKQIHTVQKCFPHKGYINSIFDAEDDIALLKLATEATVDKHVFPACLPSSKMLRPPDGKTCVISGFGRVSETTRSYHSILQFAEVNIIPKSKCDRWYSEISLRIPSYHFCAGFKNGRTDSCAGDSGGPLVCQRAYNSYTVFGITSFGYGCARSKRPGVYTDVVAYIDWIYSVTNIKDDSSTTPGNVNKTEYPPKATLTVSASTPSTDLITSGSKLSKWNSSDTVSAFKCGVSNYVDGRRIVNGKDAKHGQWPWQALVYHRKKTSYKFKCGGTLIGRKWVLTAAHCVQIECENAGIAVLLGVTNRKKNKIAKQNHTAQECFPHKVHMNKGTEFGYNYSKYGYAADIALLELATEATVGKHVIPACLPSSKMLRPPDGETCVISGFGKVGETSPTSLILKYAEVNMIPKSKCDRWYSKIPWEIPSDHFCAGFADGRTDSCQGDSGGPVVCQRNNAYTVFGITSFAYGCARLKRPGVYTDVVAYMDWIYGVINNSSTTLDSTKSAGILSNGNLDGTIVRMLYADSSGDVKNTASTLTTSGNRYLSLNSFATVLAFSMQIFFRH